MCQCGYAQVVSAGTKFSFTQDRYAVVGFMAEFVEPGLGVGEGEDEFDEMRFVEHGEL